MHENRGRYRLDEKPASHFYFSDRLRLHYLDWGNDESENLLFIHGIWDHSHAWDWAARRLRDRFHILVPDLRGHGDSEWTKGASYALIENVYDIYQLIRQRELAPLKIVGHSLGGTIASLIAGTYPNFVSKLVLIEGVGLYGFGSYREASMRISAWVDSSISLAGRTPRRYRTFAAAAQRMRAQNPHLTAEQAHHLTAHGSHQNEDGTYSWKFDNYTRKPAPYDISDQDKIELWKRITARTLIINSDEGYPHRIGQDGTLQHFHDVRLEEVGKASHWTHHDQLDQVVTLIEQFLLD